MDWLSLGPEVRDSPMGKSAGLKTDLHDSELVFGSSGPVLGLRRVQLVLISRTHNSLATSIVLSVSSFALSSDFVSNSKYHLQHVFLLNFFPCCSGSGPWGCDVALR
jgi:hypothetical protein